MFPFDCLLLCEMNAFVGVAGRQQTESLIAVRCGRCHVGTELISAFQTGILSFPSLSCSHSLPRRLAHTLIIVNSGLIKMTRTECRKIFRALPFETINSQMKRCLREEIHSETQTMGAPTRGRTEAKINSEQENGKENKQNI